MDVIQRRIVPLLITVTVLLAGCQAQRPVAQDFSQLFQPRPTEQAAVQPLSGSGFLEAEDVTIAADVSAPIVSINADLGQAVQAGQPLVTLDDTLVQAQRAQAAATVDAAQAIVTQTLAGPRPDAVAAAQADLGRATAEYLGALQAVTDTAALVANPPGLATQIAQAETSVRLTEQGVQQANAEREQTKALRDQIPAGMAERDLQEQKLNAAEANVEAARSQYDGAVAVLEQLNHMRQFPADLVAKWHAAQSQAIIAAAKVNLAQAALAAARAMSTPEQIAMAQAGVETARANLALIDAQLTHYHVTSPISGVVTSKPAQVGEVARAAAPLLVVSNLSSLKLVVYIPAGQMGRITIGDSANVTTNAYPDEHFNATITRIAAKAEFTPSNVQTKDDRAKLVFAVTLTIPNPGLRLKAGMPADAAFDR